jgi:excisionase family DNA binding protein
MALHPRRAISLSTPGLLDNASKGDERIVSRPAEWEVGMAEKKTTMQYLKTGDVADMLHISPKTVTRWARDGKLPHSRTLGGHRRFPADDIEKLAFELSQPM